MNFLLHHVYFSYLECVLWMNKKRYFRMFMRKKSNFERVNEKIIFLFQQNKQWVVWMGIVVCKIWEKGLWDSVWRMHQLEDQIPDVWAFLQIRSMNEQNLVFMIDWPFHFGNYFLMVKYFVQIFIRMNIDLNYNWANNEAEIELIVIKITIIWFYGGKNILNFWMKVIKRKYLKIGSSVIRSWFKITFLRE